MDYVVCKHLSERNYSNNGTTSWIIWFVSTRRKEPIVRMELPDDRLCGYGYLDLIKTVRREQGASSESKKTVQSTQYVSLSLSLHKHMIKKAVICHIVSSITFIIVIILSHVSQMECMRMRVCHSLSSTIAFRRLDTHKGASNKYV